jgi:hypothetical protein
VIEFWCLWLAGLNLPPPPGSAGQRAYHTNLGPWDQVFNPRGSRRDWPKERVDLFGSLRALFSGPSFSTFAFSSTACPFPSAWARGSRKNNQKLRAPTRLHHFPKIKLAIQTTGTWLLYLLDLPLIPADQFFFTDKNPNNWLYWLVEPFFVRKNPKQCYQWLGL